MVTARKSQRMYELEAQYGKSIDKILADIQVKYKDLPRVEAANKASAELGISRGTYYWWVQIYPNGG